MTWTHRRMSLRAVMGGLSLGMALLMMLQGGLIWEPRTLEHEQQQQWDTQTTWKHMDMTIPPSNNTTSTAAQLLHSILPVGHDNKNALILLKECAPTNHIRLRIPFNKESPWIIQTLDENRNPKTIGGDEWIVSYYSSNSTVPTATAFVKDLLNGKYSLDFVGTPFEEFVPNQQQSFSNESSLVLFMPYTCGVGRLPRPTKDSWEHGGLLWNATVTLQQLLQAPKVRAPPPSKSPTIDLSRYDKVLAVGDSLMRNFAGICWKHRSDQKCFGRSNLFPTENVGSVLRYDQWSQTCDKLDAIVLQSHNQGNNDSIALILGSAIWEIASSKVPPEGPYYNASRDMYRRIIQYIQTRYPHISIYWKSPQAIHMSAIQPHCLTRSQCRNRIRYASMANAEYLHQAQGELMQHLGIPVLNVWDVSYGSPHAHMPGDAIHYTKDFNERLLSMFYH